MIAPAYPTAFRALIALAALAGVTIECLCGRVPVVLSFFTIWTNVAVAVVYGISAARTWRRREPLPPLVTGGVLLFILITGLVYHLVLANPASPFNVTDDIAKLTGARAVADLLLHTVTPVGAVLEFALLTAPRRFTPRLAALWLAYPLAYVGFALVRGALLAPGTPTRYTYPFIDAARYGYAQVAVTAVVLGLAFYALALLLVLADRLRPDLRPVSARPAENRISSPGAGPLK
ncbi:Pr6Pr family membrane protein [Streptomyces sp. NPDC086023]|uniref:Pr6Pr family membrane protein n=1 Tax=Streptomyces sp. NPDC086023 TaxID=3365746 RepID=UPI0037D70CE0